MVQSKCSVGPCVLVIFGASGDLTRRKLLPALFRLEKKKLVPEHYKILGIARTPKSREQFQKETKNHLKAFMPHSGFDERTWKKFQPRLFYQEGSISDMNSLQKLKKIPAFFFKSRPAFSIIILFCPAPIGDRAWTANHKGHGTIIRIQGCLSRHDRETFWKRFAQRPKTRCITTGSVLRKQGISN